MSALKLATGHDSNSESNKTSYPSLVTELWNLTLSALQLATGHESNSQSNKISYRGLVTELRKLRLPTPPPAIAYDTQFSSTYLYTPHNIFRQESFEYYVPISFPVFQVAAFQDISLPARNGIYTPITCARWSDAVNSSVC